MNFNNTIPEWKNEGTEPSTDLKTNGFQGGYKPPAGVFNWFWSLVSKCISELQSKLKTHTHGIDSGGTGATVRKDALKNLSYLGDEPIKGTDNDTVANWVALGTGFAYYSVASQIIGQPTAHGTIISITNGKGDLTQIWQNRPSAITFVRGGNSQGWFNEGNWEKLALNSDLAKHTARVDNPHGVTKAQVGLGNVDNTADADKSVKNASLYKNHDMRGEDCFMYVTTNTVTLQTTEEWYLRIKLNRQYSNNSTPIRLCADYDNSKCVLYLTLEGIANKWSARVTEYNTLNITGFRMQTAIKDENGTIATYIYLRLRAPASGTGTCQIHTDYNILEMVTYDGMGEEFEEIDKGFYTNLPVVSTEGVNGLIQSTEYAGCYYRMVDDVKEWINPPMIVNATHLTAKRYAGKPVYATYIDVGTLPQSGGKTVAVGQSGDVIDNIVTLNLFAYRTEEDSTERAYQFPLMKYTGEIIGTVRKNGERTIYIYAVGDLSSFTGKLYVEFTKK